MVRLVTGFVLRWIRNDIRYFPFHDYRETRETLQGSPDGGGDTPLVSFSSAVTAARVGGSNGSLI